MCEFFFDTLKKNHNVLSLFFYKSILNPFWLRLTFLLFEYSIEFNLNALFYTESQIDSETLIRQTEGNTSVNIKYTITKKFFRFFWPALIAFSLKFFLKLIVRIPHKYYSDVFLGFKSQNKDIILNSM